MGRLPRFAACATIAACLALPLIGPGASAPARAATWVEVGIATDGVQALVDTDTIVRRPGSVEVRQRFVMPHSASQRIAYVDQQVVYACSRAVVKTVTSTEYDAGGRMLRRDGADRNPAYKVMPGTLPRYILDVLC